MDTTPESRIRGWYGSIVGCFQELEENRQDMDTKRTIVADKKLKAEKSRTKV